MLMNVLWMPNVGTFTIKSLANVKAELNYCVISSVLIILTQAHYVSEYCFIKDLCSAYECPK